MASGERRLVRSFDGPGATVNSLAFSPDIKRVVSSAENRRSPDVWDVDTGHAINSVEAYSSDVNAIALSPDGHWIVASAGGESHLTAHPTAHLEQ